jgi:phosphoglycerol transferase MdoB-like AlkP superfamily enzyme
MDQLSHIRTVFSIIIGLSVAHLLKGVAKIIEDPQRNKPYAVHLLWVLFIFLLVVDFWWWEFKLASVTTWNFAMYGYIILYVIVYYQKTRNST